MSSCFVVELRFGEDAEFLCVRSDFNEAIAWCETFDMSDESNWYSIVILEAQVDPDQTSVHTAARIVWEKML